MNEPQAWTAIGVLAAALVGLITVTTQLMMRTIATQFTAISHRLDDGFEILGTRITSLQTEMTLKFENVEGRMGRIEDRMDQLDGRMDQLDGRMDRLDGRIDRLEKKVDDIDRDVQAISRRVFPE